MCNCNQLATENGTTAAVEGGVDSGVGSDADEASG